MHAVFLDYATVSNGDLNTASLTAAMPDLTLFEATATADAGERLADAEIVLLNKFKLTP